jgi:hypothetical protein
MYAPSGDRNWVAVLRRVTDLAWFGRTNGAAQAPLALNDENILALNAAGTGTVGLIKANASDVPQIGDSAVITTPSNTTGSIVTTTGTQTLTNKISGDIKRASASVTANGTTTYAIVTGLSTTVVAGTYKFRCVLPSTVASGTGGIKYGFKLTTTVLTSIESTAMGFTASAVAVQHTTTATDLADLFTQAAVVILTVIEGTAVVGTGGTIAVHMAQNTSNASNTVALLGGTMEFTRIA